jgi:predicted ATPase/class 3 adenylate cyclase
VLARNHLPRGLVTFLFTDIESSTRLAQMLGTKYRSVLTEHRRLLCHTLSTCRGTPLFSEGDSLFVAFSDSTAALRACARAQRELARHEWPGPQPLVRMGLHTGYAEPKAGEYASPEVHLAARISAAAHGGQVLCSAQTARYAGDLGDDGRLLDLGMHQLRGFDARQRLFQLVAPGLMPDFPRPRTMYTAAHNLPARASSFIDRRAERQELTDLVDGHRLVTVVGMGGAGKTRLAVEAARSQVVAYSDGVWFVDLAQIRDAALAPAAVATTLGLRPEPGRPVLETIAEYASGRRFLLVMDTCDTYPGAAATVIGRLLHAAKGVRILATSREPLGLPGEVVWRIPPMSLVPGPDGAPSDALDLLLERAAAARGVPRAAYPGDARELADLGRVTQHAGGLPLAIELAAAWLRVLTPGALAARTADVLCPLDAGRPEIAGEAVGAGAPGAEGRHVSMAASLGWSYRALDERRASLLCQLSAFAGPVDLRAVAWLYGEDPLDALAALVDKSLVQADPVAGGMAYRLLDPVRAYATRRLVESGQQAAVRDRHVAWALHALRRAHTGADGSPPALSLHAIDPLAGEVSAALSWTVDAGSARSGMQLASGLDQWWRERGLAGEGRMWLARLYERAADTGEQVPPDELTTVHQTHALLARWCGEHAEESHYIQRAEAAARRIGHAGRLARVLATRGGTLLVTGDLAGAERVCRETIQLAQEQGVPGDALAAVYTLAEILWRRGALDEAAELLATARTGEAAQPSERGRRAVDLLLGMVALARGDLVAAHDHLAVALRSRMAHGFSAGAGTALYAFAVRCALGGDAATAAKLFGAARARRVALRYAPTTFDSYWVTNEAVVRERLGDEAFDEAYRDGATLTLEQAAALALAVEHPDLAMGSIRFAGTP